MKRLLPIVLVLTACATLFMAMQPVQYNNSAVEKIAGLKVGDTAPDFKLEGIDGKFYSLDDVKDANGKDAKGWIVTFTCNTCPVAKAYEDRIQNLHSKMSEMGYPVVAIMPNDITIKPGDSMAEMKKRAADKGFTFAYLMDAKQEIFPQYGATRTPEIFLLDSNKVLRYTGAIDNNSRDPQAVTSNYVHDAVKMLEMGKDPDPSFTKAIGCSIKTKS